MVRASPHAESNTVRDTGNDWRTDLLARCALLGRALDAYDAAQDIKIAQAYIDGGFPQYALGYLADEEPRTAPPGGLARLPLGAWIDDLDDGTFAACLGPDWHRMTPAQRERYGPPTQGGTTPQASAPDRPVLPLPGPDRLTHPRRAVA